MLPTVEQALVGSVKRRYRLDEMHAYYPDLRARLDVIADRDLYPIRQILWQIIADLDPWNSQAKRVIELQITFSPAVGEFIPQSKNQIPRAVTFLQYLQWAEKMLVDNRELLNQEISLRWQGNYDLMLAQVVAYQARLVEYGAAIQFYSERPPTAPATRGNTRLVNWDIRLQKELRAEAQSRPIIDRAMKLFELVNKNHPGTPWAARSQWEMKRQFGVRLEPDYEPVISRTAGASPIPVPKL